CYSHAQRPGAARRDRSADWLKDVRRVDQDAQRRGGTCNGTYIVAQEYIISAGVGNLDTIDRVRGRGCAQNRIAIETPLIMQCGSGIRRDREGHIASGPRIGTKGLREYVGSKADYEIRVGTGHGANIIIDGYYVMALILRQQMAKVQN